MSRVVDDPIESLKALRTRARELAQRHGDAARAFRQSSAVGGVLAEVGVRWLEGELGFPGNATRKAAAELRARWRETPTYRHLEQETMGLVDEAHSLLSRTFTRPPSWIEVRKAVLVSTKCQRLDKLLDGAIERAERWIASGKQLPVRTNGPQDRHPVKARGATSGFPASAMLASTSQSTNRPWSSRSRAITKNTGHWTEWLKTLAALLGIAAFISGGWTMVMPIGYAILAGLGSAGILIIILRTAWKRNHSRR